ncbi:MAG: hypothetical protein ABII96_02130 [Candidatus Zixiibacteriota bacterium]
MKNSPCLPAGRLTPLCPPGQRPYGLEAKEGNSSPPYERNRAGREEGFGFQCPYNYGLINNC